VLDLGRVDEFIKGKFQIGVGLALLFLELDFEEVVLLAEGQSNLVNGALLMMEGAAVGRNGDPAVGYLFRPPQVKI
jgi:hypothetical protein